MVSSCPLCTGLGGLLVAQTDVFRVVRVTDQQAEPFPAFYRLVWQKHLAEWSDLSASQRQHGMQALVQVEKALRQHLHPTKINLASLGNVVPHLHWHIVARFDWDSHFPNPI
jgi:diadenosine tetraphosphate (Ap4A) HIT family hydrolase